MQLPGGQLPDPGSTGSAPYDLPIGQIGHGSVPGRQKRSHPIGDGFFFYPDKDSNHLNAAARRATAGSRLDGIKHQSIGLSNLDGSSFYAESVAAGDEARNTMV